MLAGTKITFENVLDEIDWLFATDSKRVFDLTTGVVELCRVVKLLDRVTLRLDKYERFLQCLRDQLRRSGVVNGRWY